MFPLTLELNLEFSYSSVKRLVVIPEILTEQVTLHVQGVSFLLQLEHVQGLRSQELAEPLWLNIFPGLSEMLV